MVDFRTKWKQIQKTFHSALVGIIIFIIIFIHAS